MCHYVISRIENCHGVEVVVEQRAAQTYSEVAKIAEKNMWKHYRVDLVTELAYPIKKSPKIMDLTRFLK